MIPTATFRRQHAEMLALMREAAPRLRAELLARDADAIRALIANLGGVLSIHLAMEDRSLYPLLIAHTDSELSGRAARYADEMGGLEEVVRAHRKRWVTADDIRAQPDEFVSDTLRLFALLTRRVKREDQDLYDLVDRLRP